MSNAINWFSIPVSDLSKAKSFYEKVLDIQLQEVAMGSDKMAFFPADEGVGGSLNHQTGEFSRLQYVSIYLSTNDLNGSLERVEASGGKLISGKTQISPEFGYFGVIADPEGNLIGLHSYN